MITVTILTKNNEETLQKTLESVKDFDEVLILDNGSTDGTLAIAAKYPNVRIEKTTFKGFGLLKNEAADLAKNDWILSLDADEVLTESLPKNLNPKKAYSFPFHNFYNGKWIKGCGWYPDRHVRLYNKKQARFSDAYVHEKLQGGIEEKLTIPINHYSYRSLDDFARKLEHYSTLFAEQNKGKKSSMSKAAVHGFWAFIKSYILKRGLFCGSEGFLISKYNAKVAYHKYRKLAKQ